MKVLKLHDHGMEVRQFQLLLNSILKLFPKLNPDGHFGQLTHNAVVTLQKRAGLEADGEVGARTRAALSLKPVSTPAEIVVRRSAAWMDMAVAELGVHEDSIDGQHNDRIVEYHRSTGLGATDDETPWCSSFVNWVMQQSGRTGTGSAAAKSWLDWGDAVAAAKLGDVVVIKKQTPGVTQATGSASGFHVGFFISITGTHVRILGGNQGNQVKYSNFALSSYKVEGYRRPL